jgi:hypothetical protein
MSKRAVPMKLENLSIRRLVSSNAPMTCTAVTPTRPVADRSTKHVPPLKRLGQRSLRSSQTRGLATFRSADGLRQFRMTTSDLLPTHGTIGSHVHFEALDHLGKVIENLHLPVSPVMRIRAKIRSVTGKATHLQGVAAVGAIEIVRLPDPIAIEVVARDGAFYLLRMDKSGQCIADTWHETVEAAKSHASLEFGVEDGDWTEA